jgi:hypothetical protein
MSPASFPVLGLAAVVSSPALYNGLVTGSIPIEQMLTRYLISVAVVWAALSVLGMMVGSVPKPVAVEAPEPTDAPSPGA